MWTSPSPREAEAPLVFVAALIAHRLANLLVDLSEGSLPELRSKLRAQVRRGGAERGWSRGDPEKVRLERALDARGQGRRHDLLGRWRGDGGGREGRYRGGWGDAHLLV